MKIFLNLITYQAIWFVAVTGGNRGAAAGVVLLLVHLFFSSKKSADLQAMGVLAILGIIVDGGLQRFGFFHLYGVGPGIPFWLLVVWLGLAITINHSLAWLQDRLFLSGLLGAVGGPAAYYAGTRLGAASFQLPAIPSLLILGVIWGLVFPAIMFYCSRGKRVSDV